MTAFPIDDEYVPDWHDRPDDLGPDDEDDDREFTIDDDYLRDETPDDRRVLIALHARQYWMTHR